MYVYVQIYVYTLNLHIGWYCSYCGALRDLDITSWVMTCGTSVKDCVAMCCTVLHCVAVCCSVSHYVADSVMIPRNYVAGLILMIGSFCHRELDETMNYSLLHGFRVHTFERGISPVVRDVWDACGRLCCSVRLSSSLCCSLLR